MLTFITVDSIENFNLNSQLMQLIRFYILEFKGLLPLLCSRVNQVKYFFLFWGFLFTYEQLTISFNPPVAKRSGCHPLGVFFNFSREWGEISRQTYFLAVGSSLGHLSMKKILGWSCHFGPTIRQREGTGRVATTPPPTMS